MTPRELAELQDRIAWERWTEAVMTAARAVADAFDGPGFGPELDRATDNLRLQAIARPMSLEDRLALLAPVEAGVA